MNRGHPSSSASASPPSAKTIPRARLEPLDLMLAAVRNAGADALPAPAASARGRRAHRRAQGPLALPESRAARSRARSAPIAPCRCSRRWACCSRRSSATRAAPSPKARPTRRWWSAATRAIASCARASKASGPRSASRTTSPTCRCRPRTSFGIPAELRAGMKMPVGLYAIMESAYRARNGWSIDEPPRPSRADVQPFLRDRGRQSFARGTASGVDPQTIRNASERNPMQAFPYTKLHCSTWNVDQAGALLFCSEKRADELGIAHDKRIYPAREHRVEPHGAGVDPCELRRVSRRGHRRPCGARCSGACRLPTSISSSSTRAFRSRSKPTPPSSACR